MNKLHIPRTPMSVLANNRSFIVKIWTLLDRDSTRLTKAQTLTAKAVELGYIEQRESIKGATLDDWVYKNKAPLWACKAALALCLNRGWEPETFEEWAVFAHLFIRLQEDDLTLNELLDHLPDDFSLDIAAGWLTAAIEERVHFKTLKKRQ